MEYNRPKPVDCEHYEQGYYAGFRENKGYILLSFVWVLPKVVRRVIKGMRKVDNLFPVQSERENFFSVVDELEDGEPPMAENRRYDPHNSYYFISKGPFNRAINNMTSAASWRQRIVEKQNSSNPTPGAPKNEVDVSKWSFDDAANAFHKNFRDFVALFDSESYLYDQFRFEKEFNMIWCCGPTKCLKPMPCENLCKSPNIPPKIPNEPDHPIPIVRHASDLKALMLQNSYKPEQFHVHLLALDKAICNSSTHSKIKISELNDTFVLPGDHIILYQEGDEDDCDKETISLLTYHTQENELKVELYDVVNT